MDEIDKLGSQTHRGNPAAALLEVLDPAQNTTYLDNYLGVPYDLSHTLFIATANNHHDIPPALKDRLEMIFLNTYTLEEKIKIAQKHLIQRQKASHALEEIDFSLGKSTLAHLITHYTSEAGVRNLERKIAQIARKIAKAIVLKEHHPKKITKKHLRKLLGTPTNDPDTYQKITQPGVAIGLAWTPVGGDILFIETALTPGKGKLILSGNLGDVMKESATTAYTYLKAHADTLGIAPDLFQKNDLHIHIPAGAIPKDGPSAGITLYTAIASLYTQHKVKDKLAMTGEITLRGTVLPVGGIKEKILAAKRAGITHIVLSHKNKKNVAEIALPYRKQLTFHYVENMQDALAITIPTFHVAK